MAESGQNCLGMFHGKISKLLLDLETEKELAGELKVRRSEPCRAHEKINLRHF